MAQTTSFTHDQRITVLPFSRQNQGQEVIIGRVESGQFLAIPPEAVEILEDLAQGSTVGEAQALYRERYGETPEIEDFLATMEARGFVQRVDALAASPSVATEPVQRRAHFDGLSAAWARRLFSRPVLIGASLVIGLALTAIALDPSLVPGPSAFYFESHRSLIIFSLFLWNLMTVFIHELGHLTAARAVGIRARMGLSHRLWILVAETDLTGLWSVSPRERYLPLLAGPLIDMFSVSVLMLIFWAQKIGWIAIPPVAIHFAQAIALGYLLRLLWQCLFFVRTDFYYALITLLGSTNLMHNTEMFLRYQIARATPWLRPPPLEDLPPTEARSVRLYAPFYVAGRILAFWSLFFITLPVLWRYLKSVATVLGGGYRHDPVGFVDSLVLSCLIAGPSVAGLVLWIRSLFFRRSIAT
jgi:putative peptide zinc metalloprotease protein